MIVFYSQSQIVSTFREIKFRLVIRGPAEKNHKVSGKLVMFWSKTCDAYPAQPQRCSPEMYLLTE